MTTKCLIHSHCSSSPPVTIRGSATRWRRVDHTDGKRSGTGHIKGKARRRYLMMLGPGAVAVSRYAG